MVYYYIICRKNRQGVFSNKGFASCKKNTNVLYWGKRKTTEGRVFVRNLPKLLFQRVVVVSLAILLQILFVLTGVLRVREYWHWVRIGMTVLSWVTVLSIMTGRSNPSYKIAWMLLILAFPVAGITIYLLFGGNRVSDRESRKMNRIEVLTAQHLRQDEAVLAQLQAQNTAAWNHARYLLASSRFPVYHDADAEYFSSGEAAFAQMLAELEKAEHYIFLEFFIIDRGKMWDSILEILHRKAMQGVDVRVMYDDFGCITRLPMHYCRTLRELGIQAHAFNPFIPVLSGRLNNRDHRKLMIIDGKVGFTGGVNLADEYINEVERFGRWKDCAILLRGEAVWSMVLMFLSIWDYTARLEEDIASFRPDYPAAKAGQGFLQPFADSPLDHEDVGATIFQSLIQSASRRLWIMTPYLILDDKMISALCVAAKTGVDVRIITPGIPDKWYVHAVTRANYEPLTEAGVRIFEFKPGFIHSKVCLSDDQYAVVGTVNMDFRSLYLHFEDAVYLYDTPAVAQVETDFEQTWPLCREITYARCRHVHLHQRFIRALLQVFSPLL